jgi:hypothetical protein
MFDWSEPSLPQEDAPGQGRTGGFGFKVPSQLQSQRFHRLLVSIAVEAWAWTALSVYMGLRMYQRYLRMLRFMSLTRP